MSSTPVLRSRAYVNAVDLARLLTGPARLGLPGPCPDRGAAAELESAC
ncbi:hypothetical protein OG800_06885 [Streptomyces sp. NBC_00445]